MDQPVPTIAVEPPKTNRLLFSLIGIAILIVGVVVGLLVGKYIYTPKPLPTPLPAEASAKEEALTKEGDPTVNWKTYTNDKDGYSVKYPPEYRHTFLEDVNKNETARSVIKSLDLDNYTEGEELHTGGVGGDHIQISIYPDSGDSWSEIPVIDSSTDTVIFGGQKALREISPIPFIVIGPIKHSGKIYKIQYDIPNKKSDFSNFYTMLSTFRFLDQEPPKCNPYTNYCDPNSCDYDPLKCK